MIIKTCLILSVVIFVRGFEQATRWKRSLQPGAPNIINKDQPWQLDPHIERDDNGNTKTDVNIQHHGPNHDFEAGWSKVLRGPNRAKPTWHVGGTYRWRRSLQPGAPNIVNNNNNQPWQLDPHIERDDSGNTRTRVNIQHHGDNHDFEADWSKVLRGPNRAKPTWHVGGTYRWKRSLADDTPKISEDKGDDSFLQSYGHDADDREIRFRRSAEEDNDESKPWQLIPNLERDHDGNTKADVNLKRQWENHDLEASWSTILDGPGRSKPTWHVGGTIRF